MKLNAAENNFRKKRNESKRELLVSLVIHLLGVRKQRIVNVKLN